MKKNVVKLNENTLRKIIAESVKKVLKESMQVDAFKEQLLKEFHETLLNIYKNVVNDFCKGEKYGPEYFMDTAEEMAELTAEELTNDSLKVLNSNDWDVPKNNFRPLEFVMGKQGIHNFQELLATPNPVDIYVEWFWDAFGTFGIEYNFQEMLGNELYDLERQEEN